MRGLLVMSVMLMGRLSKVGAVVQEETVAEEKKAFMDRLEVDGGGTENVGKELIKRRKPPPYMIKLFEDHTR